MHFPCFFHTLNLPSSIKTITKMVHVKSDSEATSIEALTTPPRSPRRPLYYVQSPSHSLNHDHHDQEYVPDNDDNFHYHSSPIHHSRESSTSRFSSSLKNGFPNSVAWKRIRKSLYVDDPEQETSLHDDNHSSSPPHDDNANFKFYAVCFLFFFLLLFSIFSLILWASSLPYKPKIFVKDVVFENFNVQAGMDDSGVPTDMLTLNSTVKIFFRNPATFFGVHVTATPLQFHYFDLELASGQMKKFYESRKSERVVVVVVKGHQVPLYGGIPVLSGGRSRIESTSVPLNLTFVMRSRAYILGRLVKTKFYRNVLCELTLRSNHLSKPIKLGNSAACVYE